MRIQHASVKNLESLRYNHRTHYRTRSWYVFSKYSVESVCQFG